MRKDIPPYAVEIKVLRGGKLKVNWFYKGTMLASRVFDTIHEARKFATELDLEPMPEEPRDAPTATG